MGLIQAIDFVADELVKNKDELVILSGSAARGKIDPKDLDVSAIFERKNPLLNKDYRKKLVERLKKETRYKVHLFDYNESQVFNLIKAYNEEPNEFCLALNALCLNNVRKQWMGWPLAWIFGDEAEQRLYPYGCFQKEFQVLRGEEYLEGLRRIIRQDYRVT